MWQANATKPTTSQINKARRMRLERERYVSEQNGPSFTPEVDSEEEWDANWQEFVSLARQYVWPEELIQTYLADKVSYKGRLKSLEKIRELHEAGRHREAFIENKRTVLRVPMDPADVRAIRKMFQGAKEVDEHDEKPKAG